MSPKPRLWGGRDDRHDKRPVSSAAKKQWSWFASLDHQDIFQQQISPCCWRTRPCWPWPPVPSSFVSFMTCFPTKCREGTGCIMAVWRAGVTSDISARAICGTDEWHRLSEVGNPFSLESPCLCEEKHAGCCFTLVALCPSPPLCNLLCLICSPLSSQLYLIEVQVGHWGLALLASVWGLWGCQGGSSSSVPAPQEDRDTCSPPAQS